MHDLEVIKALNLKASPNVTWWTYIPVNYNDGRPIPGDVIEALLKRVKNAFGGYTFDAPSDGVWTEDGKTYCEQSRRLVVACHKNKLKKVKPLIKFIGIMLGQKCMYFHVDTTGHTEFIEI